MFCEKCAGDFVEGEAIKTPYEDNCRTLTHFQPVVTAETLELIKCLKCSSCGHSVEIPKVQKC